MGESFAQSLDEWTAYYALMGGVGATLLGLLFVAVSLRLNIFRQREVADVRDFAAFTFITFLFAIGIAGLALSPHEAREPLALALFVIGVVGLIAVAVVARRWLALNAPQGTKDTGATPGAHLSWTFVILMGAAYLALIVAALLIWRGHALALGLLAVIEAGLLALGTVAAWLLLSHAALADSGEG